MADVKQNKLCNNVLGTRNIWRYQRSNQKPL